jgi:hypothetical protein
MSLFFTMVVLTNQISREDLQKRNINKMPNMKKSIIFALFVSAISFYSCDKNDVVQETTLLNNNDALSKQSTIIPEVYSMHIDNGIPNSCENNILVFPSWDSYNATIDQLDDMIETQADAFDATVPANTTDDQYDALALAAGFDEDNPLSEFESELDFCSLRRLIIPLEEAWLAQQGDGVWDANADPDNHFIDDDTERALLNEGVEVIVGDERGDLVIYKFTADGGYIMIYNMDVTALQQINSGTIPTTNPNVVVVVPERSIDCHEKGSEREFKALSGNRIKRISKLKSALGTNCPSDPLSPCTSIIPSKIIAKTKGYKKRSNGGWKNARTLITAQVGGQTLGSVGEFYTDCMQENTINKDKTKRRRKVKVKIKSITYIPIVGTPARFNNSVEDNKLYSHHKQGALLESKDFYDLQN